MRVWLRALLSFGILAVVLALLPWSDVRSSFGRLPIAVWFGVLAGFLAGHRLGVTKWRLLVNAGRSKLGSTDALRCYAAGLFANLCLPTIVGGDVLRATLAARSTGRSEAVVLGSLADRAIDVLSLGSLLGIGALLVGESLGVLSNGWWIVAALTGLGLGSALLFVVGRLPLARWPRRFRRIAGRSHVALRRILRRPQLAVAALALSLTIQAAFILLNAWIGDALGIAVPLAVWFLAWPLAKLAGLLPISLGGLGVRDATLAGLLVPFGVPAATGLVASLIWQTVLIAGGLIGGGLWWMLSRRLAGSGAGAESVPTSQHEYVR